MIVDSHNTFGYNGHRYYNIDKYLELYQNIVDNIPNKAFVEITKDFLTKKLYIDHDAEPSEFINSYNYTKSYYNYGL